MTITPYIEQKLNKLHRGRSHGKPALHQPILLLSVLDSLDSGEIQRNQVKITPQLIARFENYTKHIGGSFFDRFYLPFFHLQSSGFWHLKLFTGRQLPLTESHSISGLKPLMDNVEYACFDDDLFQFLSVPAQRQAAKQYIIHRYMPEQFFAPVSDYILEAFEPLILSEPGDAKYKTIVSKEIDKLMRSSVFQKTIPGIYNHTCCISGMHMRSPASYSMIDACHILPLSQNGKDHIRNGISLCPNLHRAFDNFLISINENYQVVISPHLVETPSNYAVTPFAGKRILLPSDKRYYPAMENLNWHYNEFIKRQ